MEESSKVVMIHSSTFTTWFLEYPSDVVSALRPKLLPFCTVLPSYASSITGCR